MKKICKRRSYVCSFENCTAVFNRSDRLECHVRSHTGERPFICAYDNCNKSYVRASHLKRHEAIHLEKKYKCTYEGCEVVLKTEAYLKKHIDYAHKYKKHKMYKCSHCDEEFNKHSLLTAHAYNHTNIMKYVCPEEGCGKRFPVRAKLKRHSKVHNGYKCDRESCDAVLSTWGLFRKHVKLAHPAFKCKHCGKVCKTGFSLQQHEATHVFPENRTTFKCPKKNCPRFYLDSRNLAHHIKRYHDMSRFKCTSEGCYKCFNVEAHFKSHQRFHDPSLPLPSKKRKKNKPKHTVAHKLSGLSIEEAKNCENSLVAGTSTPDDVKNAPNND